MWQETKHGLYKQFNFENFKQAWAFMSRVAELAEEYQHHPRWENEWSVVQIWLITHEGGKSVTNKDHEMAKLIDEVYAGHQPKALPDAVPRHEQVKIFTDGGSRGNPGPSASGFVVLDMEDNLLVDKGVYLGVTTNNQAEYTALKLALEECHKLGAREVQVYMDSLLVVNQMKGIYKVKNRDLWPIHDAIKQLAKGFDKIIYDHVPREFNKLADAAVNRALDDHLDRQQQG
ncbi:MAG TPA: 4a-hydroxytetrahydrobiopterin dehydratase [Candidatus Saccharimonadales bacterium]|jgi:ribonuclease HI/pterin-4a-carbinolamine dehydratase|nr:4a-hydroxytetrahydrobiopterin dehydratase [Candidatus Saccharimonadales bacterium]